LSTYPLFQIRLRDYFLNLAFTDTLLDSPIPAEFKVVQQRGRNTVVIVDELGFSYSCSSKAGLHHKNRQHIWRCSKRKQKKCMALINTDHSWIVSRKNIHSHEPCELFRSVPVKLEDEIVQEYFRSY
jgi:hypothetical protein